MTNKKRHLILKINSIHFWKRVSVWKSCFDNFTSKIEFYIPDWLPKLNIHRKTCQGPFLRSSIEFFLRLNFEKLVVFFRNLLNLFILFDFRLPWISPKEFVFAFKLKNFCWSGELNLFINIWMKEKKNGNLNVQFLQICYFYTLEILVSILRDLFFYLTPETLSFNL